MLSLFRAKDELQHNVEELSTSTSELEAQLPLLIQELEEADKSWSRILNAEQKAWKHLEWVKQESRKNIGDADDISCKAR